MKWPHTGKNGTDSFAIGRRYFGTYSLLQQKYLYMDAQPSNNRAGVSTRIRPAGGIVRCPPVKQIKQMAVVRHDIGVDRRMWPIGAP